MIEGVARYSKTGTQNKFRSQSRERVIFEDFQIHVSSNYSLESRVTYLEKPCKNNPCCFEKPCIKNVILETV